MKHHSTRWSLLIVACLLVAACQDRHGPLKPTVDLAATPAVAARSAA